MSDELKAALEWQTDEMRAERDRFAHEAAELRSEVGKLKAHLSASMKEERSSFDRLLNEEQRIAVEAQERAQKTEAWFQSLALLLGWGNTPPPETLFRDVKVRLERAEKLEERVKDLESLGEKVNGVRNSIVGSQALNWSEHVYPLVATLDSAGFTGLPYPEAKARFQLLIDRVKELEESEAELEAQRDEVVRALKGVMQTGLNGGNNYRLAMIAASRRELDAETLAEAEASEAACVVAREVLGLYGK
jgi:hypothetical protein